MKKITLLLIISISGFSLLAQKHSYLLHTNANIERLKKQVEKDSIVKSAWLELLDKAEKMETRERLGAQDCQELSLAYRMTGEKQFAESIKRILIDYSGRTTWEGKELLNREPSWKGGLSTSHTCFYIAQGFDAVYNYLTNQEREQIARGIVKNGINPLREDWLLPETNFHTLDNMGHNWWSACVYMAGFASLAVRNEIPEAETWAREISETASQWFNYSGSILQNKPSNFDKEGGFYEGINYASYGVSQYLIFRLAFKNVLPGIKQPELPILDRITDFFIYNTYYVKDGTPLSVNFGDGNVYKNGNACAVLLWHLGYNENRYAWYIKQVNTGSDKEGLQFNTPVGMLLYPELPDLKPDYLPELSVSKLFKDMGWATMRNSWACNASMLAVKCGFTWNHSHADAGSFILFHNGKYLIIDSGNSSYGTPEYTTYYCQSEAHNVVLYNGKAQNIKDPYYGVKNYGHLYNLITQGETKYLFADATGPTSRYFSRNYRHFLWIGDVILIIDDLESYEPGSFEWLLHYNGQSKRNGFDLSVRDEDAEVLIRPLYPETFPNGGLPHDFPEKMRLEERIGLKDHDQKTKQPYWSVSHFEQTSRTKFITAIILKNDQNKENLPVIERFDGKDMLGIRIHENSKVTEVYLNLLADGRIKHRPSLNTMNGWSTDAYLVALTFEKDVDFSNINNLKQMFLAHGSFLRRNNKTLIHSLSKFFAIANYQNPGLEFQGQENAKFLWWYPKNTSHIQINGEKHKVEYKNLTGEIEIKLGK